MLGGRAFFVLASAIAASTAGAAACGAFDSAPDERADADGGPDATTSSDAQIDDATPTEAAADGAKDGPSEACELVTGPTFTTAEAAVTALAADPVHIYWGSTQGTTRMAAAGGVLAEPVFRDLGTCVDIVVGDFVAARFMSSAIRFKSKADLAADASTPSISGSNIGIDPRSATVFFGRRTDKTFNCGGMVSCTQVLEHPNVSSIVLAATTGFDYMAPAGAAAGVFHCPSGCASSEAGILLASATDLQATKVASDATLIYFLDPTAGAIRSVPRTGGAVSDVVTGLVAPVDFAIDTMGRLVVATLANGVFRGPKTGCVAPATAVGPTLGGFAVLATTVWYAQGAEIKRAAP